jgi:hypothetical protein
MPLSDRYAVKPIYLTSGYGNISGVELASLTGLVSLVLLVVAFASPYWLVSWQDTNSPFIRLKR